MVWRWGRPAGAAPSISPPSDDDGEEGAAEEAMTARWPVLLSPELQAPLIVRSCRSHRYPRGEKLIQENPGRTEVMRHEEAPPLLVLCQVPL